MPPATEQINHLAIDNLNNKLYLAAADGTFGHKIYKADLNGSNKTTFISGHSISSIAYSNGKLYYSKISGDYDVRRINDDGTGDELVYMPPSTEQVDCISIDGVNNKIFLAGIDVTAGHKLYKANLDGSGKTTLLTGKKIKAMANFDDPALPVVLTSFSASAAENGIILKWETAAEVDNYGFEVERTTPGSATPSLIKEGAGGGWEKIGFVDGAGNSNSPKQYSFVDANPIAANVQYRLKQINLDGSFKYFGNIAEVNYLTDVNEKQLPTEFALDQNYPNPFNPTTKIKYAVGSGSVGKSAISSEQLVTLKVYDILGNEVATLVNEHKAPGYYEVEFNAGNLSTGVYIYRLTAGEFTSTKKLILMK